MKDLREYVLTWLDNNEGQMDDEDSCFYSLCRDVRAMPEFATVSTAQIRKVYDAEKGESLTPSQARSGKEKNCPVCNPSDGIGPCKKEQIMNQTPTTKAGLPERIMVGLAHGEPMLRSGDDGHALTEAELAECCRRYNTHDEMRRFIARCAEDRLGDASPEIRSIARAILATYHP